MEFLILTQTGKMARRKVAVDLRKLVLGKPFFASRRTVSVTVSCLPFCAARCGIVLDAIQKGAPKTWLLAPRSVVSVYCCWAF
jgi:hypothetical protein